MTLDPRAGSQAQAARSGSGERWPVVIVGGGPAGLAAGLALAKLDVPALILDRPIERPGRKIGESLAPRAWPIMQRLGIDRIIDAERHLTSPGTISSWGHEGLAASDFLLQPHGRGWHLDRARFEADLGDLARQGGVEIRSGSLTRIERDPAGHWRVHVDGQAEPFQAAFLIDASGRSVAVAGRAGARRVTYDRLAAWYAFLESDTPITDARALVESQPDGWWYSALLPGGALVVAKFCDPGELSGRERSLEAWTASAKTTHWTSQRVFDAGYRVIQGPAVVAADCAISDPVAGPGLVACGDAAASYDPLSSHGIATAIASGTDAARAVHAALSGDGQPMAEYSDRVRRSFEYFLKLRAEIYGQEDRWPDAPFWSTRSRLDDPARGR